jgi:hypothetical protein
LSRKQADLVFSLVLFGLVAWMAWDSLQWDLRARLFPLVVGIPLGVLALVQVGNAIRGPRPARTAALDPGMAPREPERAGAAEYTPRGAALSGGEEAVDSRVVRARTAEAVAWILSMAAAVFLVGFELGSGAMTLLYLRFRAKEPLALSLGIAVATYLFLYVIFDRALNIPFPNGLVADALGMKAFDHYLVDPIAGLVQGR